MTKKQNNQEFNKNNFHNEKANRKSAKLNKNLINRPPHHMLTRAKARQEQIKLIDVSINIINSEYHAELRPHLIRVATKIHHRIELTSEERSLWCGLSQEDKNFILTGHGWHSYDPTPYLDVSDTDNFQLHHQPNQPAQPQPEGQAQPALIAPNQQFEVPLNQPAAGPALNLPGPEPAPQKSKSFTKQIKAQAQKLGSKLTGHTYQTRSSGKLSHPGGLQGKQK
jgi:hypothetical protein